MRNTCFLRNGAKFSMFINLPIHTLILVMVFGRMITMSKNIIVKWETKLDLL